MIYFFKPFSFEKRLFEAYDKYMSLLQSEDWGVLLDHDTCFLTPDAAKIIKDNIEMHPEIKLWTCKTNRVGNGIQCYMLKLSHVSDFRYHIDIAKKMADEKEMIITHEPISGMMLAIQKKTWDTIPKPEKDSILGIDTHISNCVLEKGLIGIMSNVYIWHTYRIDKDSKDKSHLL